MEEPRLKISIENLKGIKKLEINLPATKGVCAISGENGTGKSTLLCSLAKTVYRNSLVSYFKNDGDTNTRISISYKNSNNTWTKKINWQRDDRGDPEINFQGHHEGSVIFGTRFSDAHKSKIGASYKIKREDIIAASQFVIAQMGFILRGNKSHYGNLVKLKDKETEERYKFTTTQYLIDNGSTLLPQSRMSSGELLLATLLDNIEKISTKKEKADSPKIIILDEIELALHPSAQKRLLNLLKEISDDKNICFYIATHSTHILSATNPERIFHLETISPGNIIAKNPCYPAYASRSIDETSSYDCVIFVEDELAKAIVEKAIQEKNLRKSRLIQLISSGGWENTLLIQRQFDKSKALGPKCTTLSILDGDIEEFFNSRAEKKPQIKMTRKLFLPIPSLEKFIYKNLINEPSAEVISLIGDNFFNTTTISEIIKTYRDGQSSSNDRDGKKFLKALVSSAINEGHGAENFISSLCQILSNQIKIPELSASIENSICKIKKPMQAIEEIAKPASDPLVSSS